MTVAFDSVPAKDSISANVFQQIQSPDAVFNFTVGDHYAPQTSKLQDKPPAEEDADAPHPVPIGTPTAATTGRPRPPPLPTEGAHGYGRLFNAAVEASRDLQGKSACRIS